MIKFKLSKSPKFNLTIGLVLVAVALVIEVIVPTIGILASRRAQKLTAKAKKESRVHPNQAIADYRVALLLSPRDYFISQELADLYLRQNRPEDAIAILKKLPINQSGLRIANIWLQTGHLDRAMGILANLDSSDADVQIAISRTRLEQGSEAAALESAQKAVVFDFNKAEAQLQLGLCYAILGRTADLNTLINSGISQDALQGLIQARLGKTSLAYELYSRGLLRAAREQLRSLAALNANELLLLGRINLALGTNDQASLADAETALVRSTQADPSNVEAHQLLQTLYLKIGEKAKANQQTELIKQLETGKI